MRLKLRVGAIEVKVELNDEIMPGVVSLPHGWGHAREGTLLRRARRHAGESINDVTDEHAIDGQSGNAAFSGTPVEVEPIHDSSRHWGSPWDGVIQDVRTTPPYFPSQRANLIQISR